MLQGNQDQAPQLMTPRALEPMPLNKGSACVLQLEKAHALQRRAHESQQTPSTVTIKNNNK